MLRKNGSQLLPNPDPIVKPDYTEADVQSLRAVARGTATPEQQKRAIRWLVSAYGTYDLSFRKDSERLSVFAEGRRYAGMILVWMLQAAPTKTDPDKISVRELLNPNLEHINAEEQA